MIFEKKVLALFKKTIISRQDISEELHKFSSDDFPGLIKENFDFKNNHGNTLRGAFYYYETKDTTRVVIFDHGMGSGHRSYMKEIEALASRGFTVLTYDHTGCAESEGEDIRGFSQSLADLDSLIKVLRADENYRDTKISVVGHSWGGFSTLNIAAYHPEITHIVPISGFISIKALLGQFLGGIMRFYIPSIIKYEESINPEYAHANALTALNNSSVKALIIHSDDDPTVNCKRHFDKLVAAYKERENTTFINLPGRMHNPNYTENAVKYLMKCMAEREQARRSGELANLEDKHKFRDRYDWSRMTEQDTILWDKIRDFLNT